MKIELALKYGFCYGVDRAIDIVEKYPSSITYGPLIHNKDENNRLKKDFDIGLIDNINKIPKNKTIIIRTHGIPENEISILKNKNSKIIDATCPFVRKPQEIVKEMSKKDYYVLIFGDKNHPEIKGVVSYGTGKKISIISNIQELEKIKLTGKIAIVSQTTRKPEEFLEIVNYLITKHKEVRVFNTICNATFENQDATLELSKKSDIVIIIGGKNSSNTKQLYLISLANCKDSYLIENRADLKKEWFKNKKFCGITAGASTPNWIIEDIKKYIESFI